MAAQAPRVGQQGAGGVRRILAHKAFARKARARPQAFVHQIGPLAAQPVVYGHVEAVLGRETTSGGSASSKARRSAHLSSPPRTICR